MWAGLTQQVSGETMLRRRREKHAKQGDSMGSAGDSTAWVGSDGGQRTQR